LSSEVPVLPGPGQLWIGFDSDGGDNEDMESKAETATWLSTSLLKSESGDPCPPCWRIQASSGRKRVSQRGQVMKTAWDSKRNRTLQAMQRSREIVTGTAETMSSDPDDSELIECWSSAQNDEKERKMRTVIEKDGNKQKLFYVIGTNVRIFETALFCK
jgi:hypothetical protein